MGPGALHGAAGWLQGQRWPWLIARGLFAVLEFYSWVSAWMGGTHNAQAESANFKQPVLHRGKTYYCLLTTTNLMKREKEKSEKDKLTKASTTTTMYLFQAYKASLITHAKWCLLRVISWASVLSIGGKRMKSGISSPRKGVTGPLCFLNMFLGRVATKKSLWNLAPH